MREMTGAVAVDGVHAGAIPRVAEVDRHPHPLHLIEDPAPEARQATVRRVGAATRDRVVEVERRNALADAQVIVELEQLEIPFQAVGPLELQADREFAGGLRRGMSGTPVTSTKSSLPLTSARALASRRIAVAHDPWSPATVSETKSCPNAANRRRRPTPAAPPAMKGNTMSQTSASANSRRAAEPISMLPPKIVPSRAIYAAPAALRKISSILRILYIEIES